MGLEDTERISHLPKINPALKLKVDIEQALLSLRKIDQGDSHALVHAMKHVIQIQSSYIRMLEKQEDPTSRISEAFEHLQKTLDRFSRQTRTGQRILSGLERSSPLATNLETELVQANCDAISVSSYISN